MSTKFFMPDHKDVTGMITPVSKETFFNTKWVPQQAPLCAYDMIYHPPDYNPKAARSDRQQPEIIRANIWEQEKHKGIPSTTHLCYGRPVRRVLDPAMKEHVNRKEAIQNPHMRIYDVLEWAVLLYDGKRTCVDY